MPNILLSGPHGTGKRCMAELFAKEYLGKHYSYGCLRIDGSINRSKDVISNTNKDTKKSSTDLVGIRGQSTNIMTFAKTRHFLDGCKKVVIIYCFDRMTPEAQNAMRRIMENYSATTRFILISNEIN